MKIGIGADTGDFDKGSKKVKQALKDLGVNADSAAGKLISSFGKATVAFAGVVTAVKVVGKALNDLKDQNQVLADSWGRACEGMTGAFESLKSAVASLDFTNLISNMSEAARFAQDLYNAADAMGEIGTAYNIGLAQQLGKIDELKLKMKDTSLSEQERVKAGQELLKIYEQLEKNPTRGLGRVSDSTIDYYMQRVGANMKNRTEEQLTSMRKQFVDFFKWLGTEQGEVWLDAAEKVNKSGGLNSYWGQVALTNARRAGLETNFRFAVGYSAKMGDKDRLKLEKAVVDYLEQENKYAQETFKIRKDIQSIQNKDADATAKAAATTANAAASEVRHRQLSAEYMEKQAKKAAELLRIAQEESLTEMGIINTDLSKRQRVQYTAQPVRIPTELLKPDNLRVFRADILEELDGGISIMLSVDPDSVQKIHDLSKEVESIAQSMAVNIGESIGTLFADLATGENAWSNFGNAALSAFGDMAISVGKIAIEMGIASEGIQAALKLGNPYIAIAAGVALVALGAAVKAGLSNVASGNYSANANVASNTASSINNGYEQRDVYVNVQGVLRADGDELLAVINSTDKKNKLTT